MMFVLLALTGCASTAEHPVSRIDRLSPEELAKRLATKVDAMTLVEVVDLTKKGSSAGEIIEKLKLTHTHFALTPSQAVELANQGVDTTVLDYIHTSHQQAMMDELADEYQQREEKYRKQQEVLQEQLRLRPMPFYSPYDDPFQGYYPYWYRFPPSFRYH